MWLIVNDEDYRYAWLTVTWASLDLFASVTQTGVEGCHSSGTNESVQSRGWNRLKRAHKVLGMVGSRTCPFTLPYYIDLQVHTVMHFSYMWQTLSTAVVQCEYRDEPRTARCNRSHLKLNVSEMRRTCMALWSECLFDPGRTRRPPLHLSKLFKFHTRHLLI